MTFSKQRVHRHYLGKQKPIKQEPWIEISNNLTFLQV